MSQLASRQLERPLNEYEDQQMKDLIKLRVKGFPLQYLINSQAFYGYDFYINTSVLVPRPETEGLVELALSHLSGLGDEPGTRRFALDFGTGSGCIALALALENKDLMVYATDASQDALSVAKENARNLRAANTDFLLLPEEPSLWHYDTVPMLDLLISNPPYLTQDDDISQDVREHEPPEALFAPDHDPLYFYRFLSELLDEKLAPRGLGAFEIAEQRGIETAALFKDRGFITETHKDLAGRDRYLLARRGA